MNVCSLGILVSSKFVYIICALGKLLVIIYLGVLIAHLNFFFEHLLALIAEGGMRLVLRFVVHLFVDRFFLLIHGVRTLFHDYI